jgi:polyketide cyclase/dehydrase/lipid transport protein
MKGALHIEVPKAPDEVFDFLVDLRNEQAWNPRVTRIEKITNGPISSGSRFSGIYHGIGELTTDLVEFDRPRSFSFRSLGSRMRIEGQFRLEPTARGTRLRLSAELIPKGIFCLLAPLMAPIIRLQNAAAGERLRMVLSGSTQMITDSSRVV